MADDKKKAEKQVDQEPKAKKPTEAKDVRFRRLASRRVTKALRILSQITNLGNKAVYDYTPEQAHRIVTVLGNSVNGIKAAFEKGNTKEQAFTL